MATRSVPLEALPQSVAADATERAAHTEKEARVRTLVELHVDAVYRMLRRLGIPPSELDDGVQQVFLVLSRRLDSLEPEKEKSFLLGTALRVASEFRRTRRRHPEDATAPELLEARRSGTETPEHMLHEKQRLALLDRLLAQLSEELATVFVLFELEGQTMREIAALLSLAPGTVASRLRRARERFEELCRELEARR